MEVSKDSNSSKFIGDESCLFLDNMISTGKCTLDEAEKRMESFYAIRQKVSNLFEDRDPFNEEIQEVLRLGLVVFANQNGSGSSWVMLRRIHPEEHLRTSVRRIMQVMTMMLDVVMAESADIFETGWEFVMDGTNFNGPQHEMWTQNDLETGALAFQESYPLDVSAITIVNATETMRQYAEKFEKALKSQTVFKVFAGGPDEDTSARFKEILPKEFGGTNGSYEELVEYWRTKLEANRPIFVKQNSQKTSTPASR